MSAECPVCGDLDFQEVAGHFYCTTCNTQSQEVRVMDVDQESFFSTPGQTYNSIKKRKLQEAPKKDYGQKLPTCSVYEVYEVILLKQVDALIKLGAKPELKDIVFKLWANYLAKVGVAFTEEDVTASLTEYTQKKRESELTGKLHTRRWRNKRKERQRKVFKERKKDELNIQKHDSDFELSDSFDEDELEVDSEEERMMREVTAVQEGNRLKRNTNVTKMHIQRTLAICYLGLMATNPLTTIVDLIRWAKQSKVPYTEARDLLPARMLQWNRTTGIVAAVQTIPSREQLRKTVVMLGRLLGLPDEQTMPSREQLRKTVVMLGRLLGLTDEAANRFPLPQLIHKYLIQLDLPCELHGLVMVLVDRAPWSQIKGGKMLFWEGTAIAYIIITLKLIFGINDHSERLFSKYSRDLNKLYFAGEEKLFVWDRWVVHVAEKIEMMEKNVTVSETSKVVDFEISGSLGRPVTKVTDTRGEKLLDPEYRKALQRPLLDLMENWQQRFGNSATDDLDPSQGNHLDNSTLNNSTLNLMCGMEEEEEEEGIPRELSSLVSKPVRDEAQIQQRGETLRKCSIQHLIDPDAFMQIHEKARTHTPTEDHETDTSMDDDGQRARQKCYSETVMFQNVKRHYDYIKESYFLEPLLRIKKLEESVSYNWLSHLFCRFVSGRPGDLQFLVERVESLARERRPFYTPKKERTKSWLPDTDL